MDGSASVGVLRPGRRHPPALRDPGPSLRTDARRGEEARPSARRTTHDGGTRISPHGTPAPAPRSGHWAGSSTRVRRSQRGRRRCEPRVGRAARLGPRGLQPGNLLFAEGRLGAVIDFGRRRPGGPAVDLLAARYVPAAEARPLFRAALDAGEATWARGRGWALTIALMGLQHYRGTNPRTAAVARHVGHEALATTIPSAGRGSGRPGGGVPAGAGRPGATRVGASRRGGGRSGAGRSGMSRAGAGASRSVRSDPDGAGGPESGRECGGPGPGPARRGWTAVRPRHRVAVPRPRPVGYRRGKPPRPQESKSTTRPRLSRSVAESRLSQT